MAKQLSEKQIAAIEYLSVPKRGGLTYEQIAKEVGIAKSTLFEWKKQDEFNDALKKEVVRKTTDRLPEMFDSMLDNIIETGNAAAFRTILQMHGMLTEKVEVDNKNGSQTDIDSMKAQIEAMRQRRQSDK
ncbi:phBC6A51 family helix-turn-helix protein [Cytobacillus purgationiresistens]|uniref:Transposase n=1 Tax=Cytobacillus purgationiresistens TaxID=863449 RepID=A0ABU0AHM7_9BACI|nr:phBC6A51 family helix-turn-helix protein [Cytobacillus purgationiresistens]MDQ0270737.1 transposase [Cytobacillus purgationiresistens]